MNFPPGQSVDLPDSEQPTTPEGALAALVDSARAAIGGVDPRAGSDGPFVGEAAEGQVVAEVTAQGRLSALRVDPMQSRRPLEDLATDIVRAVNTALDARPGRPDTAPLLGQLAAVKEESVLRMAQITQAFDTALARAQQSR